MSRPSLDTNEHELGFHNTEGASWQPSSSNRQRLIENISLVAAYVHVNIAVALVLSMAFSQWPLIHLLLWLPFLVGSAQLLRSDACRRQYFMCLTICSMCLWTLVMAMIVVPKLSP